jgi:hypothetical protein
MFGPSPTFPATGGGSGVGGGSPTTYYRDLVWVDLHVAPGGFGNEETPFNTANIGLGAVPDGGTLAMLGGDASMESGVTLGARSLTCLGFSGQTAAGGQAPVLPTLTYAITTGTQRLAFRNISVALVHSGTAAGLTQFYFEFCPSISLTGGTDASPVTWIGVPGNVFSGSAGAGSFVGGTIAGYVANGGGAIVVSGCNVTGDLTSTSSVTISGGCTFSVCSITAPTITIDAASYKAALAAGVTFSSTPVLQAATASPVDIGTANSAGTGNRLVLNDHVHALTFPVLAAVLAVASSAISVNSQRITNVAAPVSGTDAARLADVQAAIQGLQVKTAADAVATANQGTLSGTAQTIDGVALNTIGMRALLTAQTTATQNGLWVVAAGAWTRPTDYAAGSHAAQSYVPISGGTLWAGSSYYCTTASPTDVVDTNNTTWTIFNIPATITAGAGLTKTGTTIDVVAGDATVVVNANELHVGVIGNSNLSDNTIALARLANASATSHFLMRASASGGAWEDGTAAQARVALGLLSSGAVGGALFPCRAATTGNITLSGTQTVDGIALVANDRCLVKNQTTGSQNGPYVVASGAWTRALDADGAGELVGGMLFPISEGTTNGNRVAQLTTDDPITIGSTTLTFAMDRVAALASAAPQDITNGAAQIGTSLDAARADHVHTLTFTVVAALLAVASSDISVNSHKITSVATPTVSTDAATKGYVDGLSFITAGAGLAFSGSTLNVGANADGTITVNANDIQVGTLVAANYAANTIALSKLVNAGAQFDLIGRKTAAGGAWEDCTPAQLQLPTYSRQIIAGTGLTGGGDLSADRTLTLGTVANSNLADNTIALGRLVNATAQNHFIMRKTAAAGAWEDGSRSDALTGLGITIGTSGKFSYSDGTSLGNTTTYTTDGNSLTGLTSIAFTGSVGAGLLKVANNPGVVLGYKSYANTNRTFLGTGGNGTTFDDLYVGDATAADGNNTLYLGAKTQVVWQIGGSNIGGLNTFGIDMSSHAVYGVTSLAQNGTPATSGWLNASGGPGSHNVLAIKANNATTEVVLVRYNDSLQERLEVGESGKVANWRAVMTATAAFETVHNATVSLSYDTTNGLDLKSHAIKGATSISQNGTPATSGWLNATNNSTALAMRGAGAYDLTGMRSDSSDNLIDGDQAHVANRYFDVKSGGVYHFRYPGAEHVLSVSAFTLANATSILGNTGAGTANLVDWNTSSGVTVGSASYALTLNSASTILTAISGQNFDFQIASGSKLKIDENKIFIGNTGSVPGTNPSGGGYLYVDSGRLNYRGSAGTVTNIAPA